MEILGHIQNGVVVIEGPVSLPEGTPVTVIPRTTPVIRVAKNRRRVQLPLVRSSAPGSVQLTNDRIAEILNEQDEQVAKKSQTSDSDADA